MVVTSAFGSTYLGVFRLKSTYRPMTNDSDRNAFFFLVEFYSYSERFLLSGSQARKTVPVGTHLKNNHVLQQKKQSSLIKY
eukprot:scaffold14146_cov108-Skeletonema_marinoi.AAC.2